MHIEDDLKLTFDDVLIRPKRSRLKSRADVTLEREFTFPHSDVTWSGIPVVAANMDTTGTFAMAQALQSHGMLTCLQKFYSVRELEQALDGGVDAHHVAVTAGSTDESFALLERKLAVSSDLQMACLDVANGYREEFLDFVTRVREAFPQLLMIQ